MGSTKRTSTFTSFFGLFVSCALIPLALIGFHLTRLEMVSLTTAIIVFAAVLAAAGIYAEAKRASGEWPPFDDRL